MDHPIKTTVKLSKSENIKQLKDILDAKLKNKNVDIKTNQSFAVKEIKP
jgi:hypothetical protein